MLHENKSRHFLPRSDLNFDFSLNHDFNLGGQKLKLTLHQSFLKLGPWNFAWK